MAHRERYMQEVRPGDWRVACRICGPKVRFATAREAHDWWREHAATTEHRERRSGDIREEARRRDVAQTRQLSMLLGKTFADVAARKRRG